MGCGCGKNKKNKVNVQNIVKQPETIKALNDYVPNIDSFIEEKDLEQPETIKALNDYVPNIDSFIEEKDLEQQLSSINETIKKQEEKLIKLKKRKHVIMNKIKLNNKKENNIKKSIAII